MKSLQTDGQTDRRRTTGDQKSSLEFSAQVSLKSEFAAHITSVCVRTHRGLMFFMQNVWSSDHKKITMRGDGGGRESPVHKHSPVI